MPVRAPLPRATARRVLAAMKSIVGACGWRSTTEGSGRCSQEGRHAKTACRANRPSHGKTCPSLSEKIFRFVIHPNQTYNSRFPVPQEGRFAIVTDVGRDAVDATASACERQSQGGFPVSDRPARRRTMQVADGEVVWS